MFSHEKLHVYGRALDFAAQATVLASSWEKKHQADMTAGKELLRRIGALLARM